MDEPYELNEPHHKNLMEMGLDDRYTYLLTHATDFDRLYTLKRGDDLATFVDDKSGRKAFPVWPHPRLAEECAEAFFDPSEPTELSLEEWLDFLGRLEKDGVLVCAMMRPDGDMIFVEPDRHAEDLRDYMGRYVE